MKFKQKIQQIFKDLLNINKSSFSKNEPLKNYDEKNAFTIQDYNLWYDHKHKHVLKKINLKLPKNKIIALIGASGCGKSSLLRSLNRMNDTIEGTSHEGNIFLGKTSIYDPKIPIEILRMEVGMIFQKPSPFPLSVKENVIYGLKSHGVHQPKKLDQVTEKYLKRVGLWDEVKDNLDAIGTSLSGGQQQRLCIARTIALEPYVLLMDEPTSALDPIATAKVEKLIVKLAKRYTIILVSHSMGQVQRISDYVVFMHKGKVVEYGNKDEIFANPKKQRTKDYLTGIFG